MGPPLNPALDTSVQYFVYLIMDETRRQNCLYRIGALRHYHTIGLSVLQQKLCGVVPKQNFCVLVVMLLTS